MKKLNAGNLRAAGYDEKTRTLVVELTSGRFEYTGVSSEVWRRLSADWKPANLDAGPFSSTSSHQLLSAPMMPM